MPSWRRCDACDVAWVDQDTCWMCGGIGRPSEKLWLTSQIAPGAPRLNT